MNPQDPAFHKPKSFVAAKNLLYAAIFISIIALLVRELALPQQTGWDVLMYRVAGYVIIVLLVKQMGHCQSWARSVLLIFYILAVPGFFVMLRFEPAISFYEGTLLIIETLL